MKLESLLGRPLNRAVQSSDIYEGTTHWQLRVIFFFHHAFCDDTIASKKLFWSIMIGETEGNSNPKSKIKLIWPINPVPARNYTIASAK